MPDVFSEHLATFTLPRMAFRQFMLALVSASDAFMLGLQNQESLSAVPLASKITFVENLFLAAMFLILNLDELIKLPAVFKHYRKYLWVKILTEQETSEVQKNV